MTTPASRRVYLISTGFQGEYEAGFANGLARNGVPVTVIGSSRSLTSRLDREVEFLGLRGDVSAGRSAYRKSIAMLRYVMALSGKACRDRRAVFHINGLFARRRGFGVLLEALWWRLVMREWWLTVHNLLPHDDETWVNRVVFGLAYRLPDRLFVHTDVTARALCARFGVRRDRVRVVEHGIDRFIAPDPHSKARVRRRFGLPPFETLVLCFGKVARYKGVDVLLNAVDRATLPIGTLVLIAGRSESPQYTAELNAIRASMRHAERVVWNDRYVAEDDIPDLLAAADCMVLPYRTIDQSGVVFAAKSAGVPVIVSAVGALADYAEPGRDVVVPPTDVDALAAALSHVARRGPCREREIHIESARCRYAWHVTLRAYAVLVKDPEGAAR